MVHLHAVAAFELAIQDHVGEWVDDKAFDGAGKVACALFGVVALGADVLFGGGGGGELDVAPLGYTLLDGVELQVEDLLHVAVGERFEVDDVVDAVEEFGFKFTFDGLFDGGLLLLQPFGAMWGGLSKG